MLSPYEIWVTGADGAEYPIVYFLDDIGLSDGDAKTAASNLLQAIIDKIATPTPDTIVVKKGMIYPPSYPVRIARIEGKLGE